MSTPLRVLVIEDSLRDFDLILRELKQAGYSPSAQRIETPEQMKQALEREEWDIVLSDHSLPRFNASASLQLLQAAGRDVPFIIVSGEIGEERAVDLMKAGATDYVSKHNLGRLIPVVERELRELAGRQERKRVERELAVLSAERERMLKQRSALLDINNAVIAKLDRTALFRAIFQAVRNTLQCDSLLLALKRPEGFGLQAVALTEGALESDVARIVETDAGPSDWVLENRRVLVRTDLMQGVEFSCENAMINSGVRSYVSAPLETKSDPFGVMTLTFSEPGALTADDTLFFTQVCRQVSLVIDNMLAYERVDRQKARLEKENAYLAEEIKSEHNFEEMVGNSPPFLALVSRIQRIAPTDATVLISGETGTGKELVARALHSRSGRRDKPLVKINCAAISAGLVESELFGHMKGAFTGALDRRVGRFEFADGGTLFLDEVGELPLDTQVKLLRVLQEHEFEPVGSNRSIQVDVRVIAATNRRLEDAVREGRFRSDLYFRLNVVPIELPPLRERRSDIPALVSHIVSQYNRQFGRQIDSVADETMERLTGYDWPGNIRELENVLARAIVLSSGSVLRLGNEFLPASLAPATGEHATAIDEDPISEVSLEDVERQHIIAVLDRTHWVIEGPRGAAGILGLHPNTLRGRMRRLNIQRRPQPQP